MNIIDGMINKPPFPQNYSADFLVINQGKGSYVEDTTGKQYLDFGSGIAVNALGYGREDLAEIAYEQMKKIIHISNLYASEPAIQLAQKMVTDSPFCAVQFGNSGSEANEAAIKYSRLYALRKKGPDCHRILSFKNAFHGRTLGALSCTPNSKYQDPFKPLVPGMEVCDYNDINQLKNRLNRSFAGVFVEVIQGEGGLDSLSKEFTAILNDLCAEFDICLIADEIQTGLTRTGTFYASEYVGLKPDIITLSKPLAGGLPLSATLIPEKINQLIKVGEHGTTFGGGPVTTAVALKVWEILSHPDFIKEVKEKGDYLNRKLLKMMEKVNIITRVKGKGMLQGLQINIDNEKLSQLIQDARKKGLLILCSGKDILRIAPPLVITKEEIDKGIDIIENIINNYA